MTARITRTTPYSSGCSAFRRSHSHSTMNVRPTNTSRPPTTIRGISPITDAPNTTAANGTQAPIRPAILAFTFMRSASAVRLSVWEPGTPPTAPEIRFASPASRSSRLVSRSRGGTDSVPETLNRTAITATNTAARTPAHWPSTADQSAPVIARSVHGCQRSGSSNGPYTSHPNDFAVCREFSLISRPSPKIANPAAIAIGITSGCLMIRVATNTSSPKPIAGSHCCSVDHSVSEPNSCHRGSTPDATYTPPLISSQPTPATNPPTTGYGMNRIRFPRRYAPMASSAPPVSSVTTRVAATTLRKPRSGPPYAVTAVLNPTIAITAAVVSRRPPTTPRDPARHAKTARVTAAAPR